jgi:D-alanyl-D-alanine carboxypeptidase
MHGKSCSTIISACLTALMVLLPAVVATSPADAAAKKTTNHIIKPLLPSPEKDAAMVVDGATGKILYARNPDAIRYPASLTKMMTLYLLFEAIEKGKISLDTPMITSVHASEQEPTKLAMGAGAAIPVDTAIKAITVLSANDVAVVVAEALGGGSEETFAQMMTEKAHELGMTHTNFHNASGLPDPLQLTTARDMAVLARHVAYEFPQYYHYFSVPGFSYAGRSYVTHDNLLAAFEGADGIKTGYTQLSGFNLVTSAVRYNKHVIGVVLGGPTAAVRDREMMRLLSAAFDVVKENPTFLADANVPWKGGKGPETALFASNPLEDQGLMLAALEPKPRGKAKDKAILVADAKTPRVETILTPAVGPAVVPILKPAVASEATQVADATLKRDPSKMPPLQLGPGPSLRVADASAQIAQGDSSAGAVVAGGSAIVTADMLSPVGTGAVKRWAVQIGAFASEALAQAKLSAFLQRGVDVLGQAQKVIVPFRADGHIMYRARIGMFAEAEARAICRLMVKRGQSCFAAAADAS